MTRSRVFQAIPLQKGEEVTLTLAASHHIARVLRARTGDQLTLFNGQGGEYLATIIKVDKKQVTVQLIAYLPKETESPIAISLAQGISRGEKMDYIIQKSVELGVKTLVPIVAERTQVRLNAERSQKRMQHWQSIIESACEQCGRNQLPVLAPPIASYQWLQSGSSIGSLRLVLSPYAKQTLRTLALPSNAQVSVLIGPEGGLSEQEIALANQQGFISLSLGPRILRTETAAIAAISAIQTHFGDM